MFLRVYVLERLQTRSHTDQSTTHEHTPQSIQLDEWPSFQRICLCLCCFEFGFQDGKSFRSDHGLCEKELQVGDDLCVIEDETDNGEEDRKYSRQEE